MLMSVAEVILPTNDMGNIKVSNHLFGLEIDMGITIASEGNGKNIFSKKHQTAKKYLANLCPASLISLFNRFFNINLSCIFEFI